MQRILAQRTHLRALPLARGLTCKQSLRSVPICPARRHASSAAVPQPTISFAPKQQSQLDEYIVSFQKVPIPGASQEAAFEVSVFGRDTLSFLRDEISKGVGGPAELIINGQRASASDLATRQVSSLFGTAVDVELCDGMRYGVNDGQRITKMGRRIKRNLLKSYAFMGAGAFAAFAIAITTWRSVVPSNKQRLY